MKHESWSHKNNIAVGEMRRMEEKHKINKLRAKNCTREFFIFWKVLPKKRLHQGIMLLCPWENIITSSLLPLPLLPFLLFDLLAVFINKEQQKFPYKIRAL